MYVKFSCISGDSFQENINKVNNCLKEICASNNPTHNQNQYLSNEDCILLELDHVFKAIRMIWRQYEDVILQDKLPVNFETICQKNEVSCVLETCLRVLCREKQTISDDTKQKIGTHIKVLRRSIFKWHEMEELQLSKINRHALKNHHSGIYHYFHTYLSVSWCTTLIDNCLHDNEDLENTAIKILKDLIALSRLQYNKISSHQRNIDPFVCVCFKTIWIGVQFLLESISSEEFWNVFNKALLEAETDYSLWLLYHVATLQAYDENGIYIGITCKRVTPNYDLIELKFKYLLKSHVTEEYLMRCFEYTEPLVNLWWFEHTKISLFQTLWEYFNKLLSHDSEQEVIPPTASKMLQIARRLENDPKSAKTAFEFFLGMLAKHLSKHRNQWGKLKGRIYSRLPLQKLTSLSKKALYKVYLMFVSLALVDFEELTGRIFAALENLSRDVQNSVFVWNLYIGLVILHLQNNRPVKTVGKGLMFLVQENVNYRDSFDLIKHFIRSLDDIMHSTSNYTLGQHIFLDSWIKKYLQSCQLTDVDELLQILIVTAECIYKEDVWAEWDPVFQLHVFPCLKQHATAPSASPQIGKLGALLCKMTPELCDQGVQCFTSDLVVPRVSTCFVVTFLQDYPNNMVLPSQESSMLQAWLRCCLLCPDSNEELTRSLLKIPKLFAPVVRLDLHTNPLCTFIEALAEDRHNTASIKSLLENFSNVDQWIKSYLKEPQNEAQILHIYTCLAVLVYNFATFLYCKTKSACILSKIISTALLPAEVLMGRTPHPFIIHSAQRTWHLYMKGIISLNRNDDIYLERILRDLIMYYVPHFPVENSPVLKCLNDEHTGSIVLGKMAGAFLSHNSKCTKEQASKVLRFFDNLMDTCESVAIMKFVAQKVVVVLLEYLLFNIQCNAAASPLISLASSGMYDAIREDVHQSIIAVTQKHLPFCSKNYFQLALILVKIIPADMVTLLPQIRKCVHSVETMRGLGFDSMLRKGLDSLEDALTAP